MSVYVCMYVCVCVCVKVEFSCLATVQVRVESYDREPAAEENKFHKHGHEPDLSQQLGGLWFTTLSIVLLKRQL